MGCSVEIFIRIRGYLVKHAGRAQDSLFVWPVLFLSMLPLLTACSSVEFGDTEAELVLEDLVKGGRTSRLADRMATPARMSVEYQVQDRLYQGDLYRLPDGVPEAGIVVIPGIAAAGKDDRRLVALAQTLARARFAVLVPDVPGFRAYQLRADDVEAIADAFQHLSQTPPLREGKPVGMFALSYAVAPAVLACLEPEIRDDVRFMVGLGGYHDLQSLITFFTTGYYRLPGAVDWRRMSPHVYGKWLFTVSNAGLLDTPEDQALVEGLAWDMLDPQAEEDFSFPWLQLGPGGLALIELVENTDRDNVAALIARLPERLREEMRALNPAQHDLSKMKATLILLHGRADNIIPYSESMALARAVPPGQSHLFVIDGLAHVNLRPKPQDLPKLTELMQLVLEQREK